jgi:hypothetical protein
MKSCLPKRPAALAPEVSGFVDATVMLASAQARLQTADSGCQRPGALLLWRGDRDHGHGCAHLRRTQAVMMAPGEYQQVARRCSGSLREIWLLVFLLEAAVTALLVVAVPKVRLLLLVCIPLLVREHDVQIHL